MANFRRILRWRPNRRTEKEPLGKEGPMTAMVIFAHPDDAEFTCGGTVAKWCAQGWTVYYVLATSGDKGTHEEMGPQQLAAVREQEQRDACRVLGVKEVIFLGFPDGFLQPDADLRGQVVRLLRRYQPDVVITWDGFRKNFNHVDHRAVGIAVCDAVYPAVRDHLYYPEHAANGLPPHQVNEMLLAGTDDADYDVDISAFLETKMEAVLCHTSQLGGRTKDELRKFWQERMRSNNGRMVESFKRVTIGRPMRQTREGSGVKGQGSGTTGKVSSDGSQAAEASDQAQPSTTEAAKT